ncbi:MAG: VTT domain-containing protein [Verrucomicrobiota bacterium]
MDSLPPAQRKLPLSRFVLAALALGVLGLLVLRWVGLPELKVLARQWLTMMRAAGPLPFFAAWAVLPAVGVPLSVFTLSAGPMFGEQLGLGGVLAAAAASLACNLTLTYWLARRWLRPWLERLVRQAGYQIPVVVPDDQLELTLLLRITPGPPYFFQSYLLGLAGIPFRRYFPVSLAVAMLHTTGLVIFAESIAEGKGRLAVVGVSVFIAVLLGIHILRRHYAGRKKPAAHEERGIKK